MVTYRMPHMPLSIPIQESDCYHEAGHAAMFVYYDIPLEYVRIRPDLAAGYGGSVKVAIDPPTTGRSELQNWMRASAAGEVATNRKVGRQELTAQQLTAKFHLAVQSLMDDPDSPIHNDIRNFALFGLYRDGATGPEQGHPEGWIPIWYESGQLIRNKLWPAVEAVASKLWAMAVANIGQDISMIPDLTGEESASIVRAAIRQD